MAKTSQGARDLYHIFVTMIHILQYIQLADLLLVGTREFDRRRIAIKTQEWLYLCIHICDKNILYCL